MGSMCCRREMLTSPMPGVDICFVCHHQTCLLSTCNFFTAVSPAEMYVWDWVRFSAPLDMSFIEMDLLKVKPPVHWIFSVLWPVLYCITCSHGQCVMLCPLNYLHGSLPELMTWLQSWLDLQHEPSVTWLLTQTRNS